MTRAKIDLVKRKLEASGIASMASRDVIDASNTNKAANACQPACEASCPQNCSSTCNTCSPSCTTCQTGGTKK